MKKSVNESGITLIALVVTIVVLLILAGITITYVLADGGIFGKAQEASVAQEKGVISDYVTNAQATLMIETYDPTNTTTIDAEDIMKKNFPTTGYSLDCTNLGAADGIFTGSFTVTKGTNVYTVSFDANGAQTVSDPTPVATGS